MAQLFFEIFSFLILFATFSLQEMKRKGAKINTITILPKDFSLSFEMTKEEKVTKPQGSVEEPGQLEEEINKNIKT